MINSVQKVIVDGISNKNLGFYFGYTENNKIIYFKGNKNLFGKLISIKIVKLHKNCLFGVLI